MFSFIGFVSRSVKVGAQSVVDITLDEEITALQEVVVTGYGTTKKENLTGSVSSISTKQLLSRPVTNATSMLQGRMPGVNIIQNTGARGRRIVMRVRGQGTYSSAGSDPLVLIDGVTGSLSNLNPNDIASVSVLKDAASAAIYGSRAANGVILVTTKNGSEKGGKTVVSYDFNYGIHTPTKLLDQITNSVEYMEMFNKASQNSFPGTTAIHPQSVIDTYRNATDRVKYPNANWQEIMFNPAPVSMHNFSISGGQKTYYNLSISHVDQTGTMKGYNYKKNNARFNIVSEINKKFKTGINLNLLQSNRKTPTGGQTDNFISTIAQAPTYTPTLPDGSGRYTIRHTLGKKTTRINME